jgi:hypothetical protein
MDIEKYLLLLGSIPQNPHPDTQNGARVSFEEPTERLRITVLDKAHESLNGTKRPGRRYNTELSGTIGGCHGFVESKCI